MNNLKTTVRNLPMYSLTRNNIMSSDVIGNHIIFHRIFENEKVLVLIENSHKVGINFDTVY